MTAEQMMDAIEEAIVSLADMPQISPPLPDERLALMRA
jgi:DNA-binding TFAR19-related protein (PDSD5 family)